mgnify:CR=1 FL=1
MKNNMMKKLTIVAVAVAALASFTACGNKAKKAELKTDIDSLSYAAGVASSPMMKQAMMSMEIDSTYEAEVIKGIYAGIKGADDKKKAAYNAGVILGEQLAMMNKGASLDVFAGDSTQTLSLENIVADADIKGIKDEFFVIVPDDEHEGCFLPYLYVQLKDGYTLDDVRDKINACLPERYMRPVEIFTVPERPFFHFKTNRIGLSKEIIAKRNQQKEKAKRSSFADGCIA